MLVEAVGKRCWCRRTNHTDAQCPTLNKIFTSSKQSHYLRPPCLPASSRLPASEAERRPQLCGAGSSILGIPDITEKTKRFCVLRHDIEFSIDRALKLAIIENEMRTIMSDHQSFNDILKELGKEGYGDSREYGNYGQ